MTHVSAGSMAKRGAPFAGVVVVVLLVLMTGWWGHRTLSGPDLTPAPVQSVNPQYSWLQEMARQCKGDFDQLSSDDRVKVDKACRGFGSRVMHDQWVYLNKH